MTSVDLVNILLFLIPCTCKSLIFFNCIFDIHYCYKCCLFSCLIRSYCFGSWRECNNLAAFPALNLLYTYSWVLHSILRIIHYSLDGKAKYVAKMKWKVKVKKFRNINLKIESVCIMLKVGSWGSVFIWI